MSRTELEPDFFNALQQLFLRADLTVYETDDFHLVQHLHNFLGLLLDHLERGLPKTERFRPNPLHWKVDLKGVERGAELRDEILGCFTWVQRAAHLLLDRPPSMCRAQHAKAKKALLCECGVAGGLIFLPGVPWFAAKR